MDIAAIIKNIVNRKVYHSFCDKYVAPSVGEVTLDIGCGLNLVHRDAIGVDKYVEHPAIMPFEADNIEIKTDTVDTIFSAHCLEHCANPIKVLYEWRRLLKVGGHILLILPHKDRTFDQHRPVTKLSHHISDFEANVTDNDLSHWPEFRDKTLLGSHPKIPEQYVIEAKRDNAEFFQNFGLIHHHVWTEAELVKLLTFIGFRVLNYSDVCPGRNDSFFVYGQK